MGALIWRFYDKVDKDMAKCRFCKKVLHTKVGSTNGLHVHIKLHPSEFKQLKSFEAEDCNKDQPSTSSKRKHPDFPFHSSAFKTQPKKQNSKSNK